MTSQNRGGRAVRQYLERYAEPEARIAALVPGHFDAALVVPVLAEPPGLLDGYRAACASRSALVVLIVNQRKDASEAQNAANKALLAELRRGAGQVKELGGAPPAFLKTQGATSLLVIDRASPGHEMPARQGVGLARRMGADLVLSLWADGRLNAHGFGCTDADVTLPADYFERGEQGVCQADAALFPFEHTPSGDARVDQATLEYEWSLRYFVLGLESAGSPYAYHSVGSTLYLNLESYAQVRGFPKRLAGEDYYLLDKLAKLRGLCRLQGAPIQISSRVSDRVPFGTGPAVTKRLVTGARESYILAPQCFEALREWLSALRRFGSHRDPGQLRREFALLPGVPAGAIASHVESLDLEAVLFQALRQARSESAVVTWMNTWFDALRTLRLLHALRDAAFGTFPWQMAAERARFLTSARTLEQSLQELRAREALLAAQVGPAR